MLVVACGVFVVCCVLGDMCLFVVQCLFVCGLRVVCCLRHVLLYVECCYLVVCVLLVVCGSFVCVVCHSFFVVCGSVFARRSVLCCLLSVGCWHVGCLLLFVVFFCFFIVDCW